MNREEQIQQLIMEATHIIIWGVSLDSSYNVESAEIYQTMDLERIRKNESPIFVTYTPSEEYVRKAIEQFKKLDWSEFKPASKDVSATSYVLKSNPNMPICSNDQRR